MKRSIILLLAVFLVFPLASAASIEDVTFLVGNNDTLDYIVPGKAQVVRIQFEIAVDEEITGLIADFTSINPEPSRRSQYISYPVTYCEEHREDDDNETTIDPITGYTCEARNIVFRPQSLDVAIPITIQIGPNAEDHVAETSFQRDNTPPRMESISSSHYQDEYTVYGGSVYGVDGDKPEEDEFGELLIPDIPKTSVSSCSIDRCYLKSNGLNEINFIVSDSDSGFEQKRIFYDLGDSFIRQVDECSSGSCFGVAVPNCVDGDVIRLSLANLGELTSGDDSGNSFVGQTDIEFMCDASAPGEYDVAIDGDIDELYNLSDGVRIDIVHPNLPYLPNAKTGDTVVIRAMIYDSVSPVSAVANFSGLSIPSEWQTGSCIAEAGSPDLYNCSWQINDVIDGFHDLTFKFFDTAGNQKTYEQQIQVDYFEQTENSTPIFFADVSARMVSAQGYNRIALDLAYSSGATYPVAVTYTPVKLAGASTVETFFTEIDPYKCSMVYDGQATSAQGKVNLYFEDPFVQNTVEHRLNIEFISNVDLYPNMFEIRCEVDAYVREDADTVYEAPSPYRLAIPMVLRNSALGNEFPGSKYADRIKDQEKRLNGAWKVIEQANKIMNTFQTLCGLQATLGAIQGVGAGLKLTGDALEKTGLLTAPGVALKQTGSLVILGTDFTKFTDILNNVCQVVSCNIAQKLEEEKIIGGTVGDWLTGNSLFGAGDGFSANIEGLSSNVNQGSYGGRVAAGLIDEVVGNVSVPNPQESILMSVATGCWSGVIYNLEKLRQIECMQLLCMKTNSRNGLDVGVCDQTKSEQICKQVISEFFEFPLIRTIVNLADNINDLIQNAIPIILKQVVAKTLCSQAVQTKAIDKTVNNVLAQKAAQQAGEAGAQEAASNAIGSAATNSPLNFLDTLFIIGCDLPGAIGTVIHNSNQLKGSVGTFNYQPQYDYCQIALCNEENPNDCNYEPPNFLGPLASFALTPGLGVDLVPKQYTAQDFYDTYDQYTNTQDPFTGYQDPELLRELSKFPGVNKDLIYNPDGSVRSDAGAYLREYKLNLDQLRDGADPTQYQIINQNSVNPLDYLRTLDDPHLAIGYETWIYEMDEHLRTINSLGASTNNVDFTFTVNGDGVTPITINGQDFTYDNYVGVKQRYADARNQYTSEMNQNFNEFRSLYGDDSMTFEEFQNDDLARTLYGADPSQPLSFENYILDQQVIFTEDASGELVAREITTTGAGVQSELDTWDESYAQNYDQVENIAPDPSEHEGFVSTALLAEEQLIKEAFGTDGTSGIFGRSLAAQARAEGALDVTQINTIMREIETAVAEGKIPRVIGKDMLGIFETHLQDPEVGYLRLRSRELAAQHRQEIGLFTSFLAQQAVANGWLGVDKLIGLTQDWQETDFAETVNSILNSDEVAGAICRNTIVPQDAVRESGSAIQCTGNLCRPVLTQAAEKITINETHKGYTIVYYLGGVQDTTDLIKYDVVLKKSGGHSAKLFNETWQLLAPGQITEFREFVIGEGDYERICLRFQEDFPPLEAGNRKEYCRTIVDSDQGESSFDTGVPVIPQQNSASVGEGGASNDRFGPGFTINLG